MTVVFLAAYLLVLVADLALDLLNLAHLRRRGHIVPPELDGYVDADLLKKTAAYNSERARLGILTPTRPTRSASGPCAPWPSMLRRRPEPSAALRTFPTRLCLFPKTVF
ncbi:MAG: hypothetical protein MUC63_07105 [Planctomycetes bacterium]|jgi:hypothetical protein|nr:hypothetical protein [Planctomycetota bacterium]